MFISLEDETVNRPHLLGALRDLLRASLEINHQRGLELARRVVDVYLECAAEDAARMLDSEQWVDMMRYNYWEKRHEKELAAAGAAKEVAIA